MPPTFKSIPSYSGNKRAAGSGSQKLFFGFLVKGVLTAPIAVTLILDLPLDLLLVFMGRVIGMLAHGTAQSYQVIAE
jgi:hypothetical protein